MTLTMNVIQDMKHGFYYDPRPFTQMINMFTQGRRCQCPVLLKPVKFSQVIKITHHIHAAHPGLSIASGHGSVFLGLTLAITRLRQQTGPNQVKLVSSKAKLLQAQRPVPDCLSFTGFPLKGSQDTSPETTVLAQCLQAWPHISALAAVQMGYLGSQSLPVYD